jgi:hypothetical protein
MWKKKTETEEDTSSKYSKGKYSRDDKSEFVGNMKHGRLGMQWFVRIEGVGNKVN